MTTLVALARAEADRAGQIGQTLTHRLCDEIERLSRPASEREPPHCSSCACGQQSEPRGADPYGRTPQQIVDGMTDDEREALRRALNRTGSWPTAEEAMEANYPWGAGRIKIPSGRCHCDRYALAPLFTSVRESDGTEHTYTDCGAQNRGASHE